MQKEIKKKSIDRLKRIEGQVRGLQKMINNEDYCIDIIHQSFAVKKALAGVEDLILSNHLSTHVIHQMKGGQSKKAIDEILQVYKLTNKK